MAAKRTIAQEILQGLRELNRGEHGRVTIVPSVAAMLLIAAKNPQVLLDVA
jgi:hypothetical protein